MSTGLERARAQHRAGLAGVRISIHEADDGTLTKLFDVHLDPRDGAGIQIDTRDVHGVGCVSVALSMAVDQPGVRHLFDVSRGKFFFVCVTEPGSQVWARMYKIEGGWSDTALKRIYTAYFDQAYPSLRYSRDDGVHVVTLVEPSPPVPFDEHHPHYPGSAAEYRDEIARYREQLRDGREH